MIKKDNFQISWCQNIVEIEAIVSFFIENVSTTYISYSEIQCGRAIDPLTWSPKLDEALRNEFTDAVKKRKRIRNGRRIALFRMNDHIVGMAVVGFNLSGPNPFIVLEDLVVDKKKRGMGLGKRILEWIEKKSSPVKDIDIFLESGLFNENAHTFFKNNGFIVVSKVLLKKLHKNKQKPQSVEVRSVI